jgi:hypothetical protein
VRKHVVVLIALAVLAAAPSALAYGWPLAPFNVEHPVRGYVGDPRTRFYMGALDHEGLVGIGAFSFHNGIDISADPGTPVYPILSGVVTLVTKDTVVVRSPRGPLFRYVHIDPMMLKGTPVVARQTVLGVVQWAAGHVHLTEMIGGRVVNPLAPGHLAPYNDTTRPQVTDILLRNQYGKEVDPKRVTEPVSVIAAAHDLPSLPVPGSWNGLPVAPALVTWSLVSLVGDVVVPETVVVDFRERLPFNRNFWRIYARGTYQNKPRFGNKQYLSTPGRYEYLLTPDGLDEYALPDGVYTLKVKAADTRGNKGWKSLPITVCTSGAEACR